MIDLISDTVTRPTSGMLQAMLSATVGDDVFREDPTINALETKVAAMFGHEAALFCPSGTMTNQIAVKVHTQELDEVIMDESSHVYLFELGGYSFNSRVAIHLIRGKMENLKQRMCWPLSNRRLIGCPIASWSS